MKKAFRPHYSHILANRSRLLMVAGLWALQVSAIPARCDLPKDVHPNAPLPPEVIAAEQSAKEDNKPHKDDPLFLGFAAWVQQYRLAAPASKTKLIVRGVELAKTRRAALTELIKTDPKRALRWAISLENRAILPAEVLGQLETRVAGCGEYSVLIAYLPATNPATPGSPPGAPGPRPQRGTSMVMRNVTINDKIYKAYVYGWRRDLTTKYNIPIQGMAVDNLLAFDESPARVLEAGETIPTGAKIGNPDHKCPLCGAAVALGTSAAPAQGVSLGLTPDTLSEVATKPVIAQVGNIYYFFDTVAHLHRVTMAMREQESRIGPKIGSNCDEPLASLIEEIKNEDKRDGDALPGVRAGNNGVPAVQ